MRFIFLFCLIFQIVISCSPNKSDTIKWEIELKENALTIPVGSDVMIDRIRLNCFKDEIVYSNNFDIHFYNYKTDTERIDTTLRAIQYKFPHGMDIFGSYPSGLILVDHRRIFFFDLISHNNLEFDLRKNKYFKSTRKYALTRAQFGMATRYCKDFLPVTDIRRYKPEDDSTSFNFIQIPEFRIDHFDNSIPEDFLNLLYNLNPNLMSPQMEKDLSGNGININHQLSCKVYNLKGDGSFQMYTIDDPACVCGLNEKNFEKAKSENALFVKSIPLYGNLYPNFFEDYYYQFIQSAKDEMGDQRTFLRIINKNYKVVARMEFPFDNYRAQLLFLPEGTFVQSNQGSILESEITFHKINLVRS